MNSAIVINKRIQTSLFMKSILMTQNSVISNIRHTQYKRANDNDNMLNNHHSVISN